MNRFNLISSILLIITQVIYGQHQYGQYPAPQTQQQYSGQGISYSTHIPMHGVLQQQQRAQQQFGGGFNGASHYQPSSQYQAPQYQASQYQSPQSYSQHFPTQLQPQSYNGGQDSGAYNPSAGGSYSQGGFPSSAGAGAAGAAGYDNEPKISTGEALAQHQKALDNHNALVAQHIKELGLPDPAQAAAAGAQQGQAGQGQYSPQGYQSYGHQPQYSSPQYSPQQYSPQQYSAPQYTSRVNSQYGPGTAYRSGASHK